MSQVNYSFTGIQIEKQRHQLWDISKVKFKIKEHTTGIESICNWINHLVVALTLDFVFKKRWIVCDVPVNYFLCSFCEELRKQVWHSALFKAVVHFYEHATIWVNSQLCISNCGEFQFHFSSKFNYTTQCSCLADVLEQHRELDESNHRAVSQNSNKRSRSS